MDAFTVILLIVSFLVLSSVLLSRVSDNLGVPALVLFIVIGMLAGSDGPGKIYFEDYSLSQAVGIISLVFILFSGGLDTNWKSTRKIMWSGVSLASLGVVIAASVVGLFAYYILHFDFFTSMLLGAVISSTDAAAVFSVLRSKSIRLKGNVRPFLEFESGSNDPMAVFLTVTLVGIIAGTHNPGGFIILEILLQFGIGILLGYVFGKLLILLMNKIHLQQENLYVVFSIAFAVFIFALASILKGNGYLAVYISAIVVGNSEFIQKKSLKRFFSGIALMSQIVMFLVLGLLSYPSRLLPVAGIGLLFSAILIFLARPLSVFVSLLFSKFSFREKSFISWVGLRGSVPIILSTFPVLAGIEQSSMLFNLVFFITISSALIQGWSIPAVAKLFGVEETGAKKPKLPLEIIPGAKMKNELADITIPANSAISGLSLAEINLPEGSLVTVVYRNDEYIVPNGSTYLEEGDIVLVLVNDENKKQTVEKLTSIK
ncbi:MAG: potassium/proton antiporter [Bacteroidetes bacterium]|nr:potassium/proton antiporter [Bacteroidota bacterium]